MSTEPKRKKELQKLDFMQLSQKEKDNLTDEELEWLYATCGYQKYQKMMKHEIEKRRHKRVYRIVKATLIVSVIGILMALIGFFRENILDYLKYLFST